MNRVKIGKKKQILFETPQDSETFCFKEQVTKSIDAQRRNIVLKPKLFRVRFFYS